MGGLWFVISGYWSRVRLLVRNWAWFGLRLVSWRSNTKFTVARFAAGAPPFFFFFVCLALLAAVCRTLVSVHWVCHGLNCCGWAGQFLDCFWLACLNLVQVAYRVLLTVAWLTAAQVTVAWHAAGFFAVASQLCGCFAARGSKGPAVTGSVGVW